MSYVTMVCAAAHFPMICMQTVETLIRSHSCTVCLMSICDYMFELNLMVAKYRMSEHGMLRQNVGLLLHTGK